MELCVIRPVHKYGLDLKGTDRAVNVLEKYPFELLGKWFFPIRLLGGILFERNGRQMFVEGQAEKCHVLIVLIVLKSSEVCN